ncbi:MAG: hypothetical protein K2R98_03470 [Gemmataceae bacterium]|nr:hypothetical protein [Gemmataceae bacterium]
MARYRTSSGRRGTVLPLMAFTLMALVTFLALAIDIGMMTIVRAQLQVAADNAALAATRALDGNQDPAYNPGAVDTSHPVPGAEGMNNYNNITAVAVNAAQGNKVLNSAITQSSGDVQIGAYYYDAGLSHFVDSTNTASLTYNGTAMTAPADRSGAALGSSTVWYNWGMVKVTTRFTPRLFFGRMTGFTPSQLTATATAAHRPRDIAIVIDQSISMAFGSVGRWQYNDLQDPPGNSGPAVGNGVSSMNFDTVFPQFGHWSVHNPAAAVSGMHRTTTFVRSDTGEVYTTANVTEDSTQTGPAMVKDFYTTQTPWPASTYAASSAPTSGSTDSSFALAFPSQPQSGSVSDYVNQTGTYAYDKWKHNNGAASGPWAATVADILQGSASSPTNYNNNSHAKDTSVWERADSTAGYGSSFTGYVVGPAYYGISFYIWPPDPRQPSTNRYGDSGYVAGDWRRRFFTTNGTNTISNHLLWTSSGTVGIWQGQSLVNYDKVLEWIKNSPVQVFPSSLYSGRLCYYTSIPDNVTWNASDSASLKRDKAFWRAYIDFVLTNDCRTLYGTEENDIANSSNPSYSRTAYFGTPQITDSANLTANPKPYMKYTDNPVRPKLNFWFGGLSMLYFLFDGAYIADDNTRKTMSLYPGTAHQAHCWHLKAGFNAVLTDIKANHPNDQFALCYFASSNSFTTSRVQLGQHYQLAKDLLFFPRSLVASGGTSNTTISSSWDGSSVLSVLNNTNSRGGYACIDNSGPFNYSAPDVSAPTGSTCPQTGFALAFNEFSTTSPNVGRKGAAKVVVFETDGYPTQYSNQATYSNSTAYTAVINNVGAGGSGDTSGSLTNNPGAMFNALQIVDRIVAQDTAAAPGYSTARTLARVHALGFGDNFDPNTAANSVAALGLQTKCKNFLLEVQKRGYTSAASDTDIQSWKYIVGTYTQRKAALKTAFQTIMQSGVKVVLVR